MQARDLCNQLYIDFQTSLAELEARCQCRCPRSTWGRTKSLFGSLTKRALSLRVRKKPDEATGPDQGQDQGQDQAQDHSASEQHPDLPVGELSADLTPAELLPSFTYVPELAAQDVSAYSPVGSAASLASALRMSTRSLSSSSSTQHLEYPQPGYNHSAIMSPPFTPTPRLSRQPRPRAPRLYVPPPQAPHPIMPGQMWPSGPPSTSGSHRFVSPQSTMSTSDGRSFVSPQSSMSAGSHRFVSPRTSISTTGGSRDFVSPQASMWSNPSSIFTAATEVTAPEAPFCDSPVGFDDHDEASWYQHASTPQDAQWPATPMIAELPGTASMIPELPGNDLDTAQWFPQAAGQQISEPEVMQFMQSMQHLGLTAAANVQQAPSQWHATQPIAGAKSPPAVPDIPWPFINQHAPVPPRQPRPQPVLTPRRQHSYNSAISSILDFAIPSDTVMSEPAFQPPSPPLSEFAAPLPQQRAATKKSVRRCRPRQPEATYCKACDFNPKPGPGLRRKMQKHYLTDGHRRKTGQAVVQEDDKARCWLCPSTFNRDDNLWSHMKSKHGLALPEERTKRKSAWRELRREFGSALKSNV